MTDPQPRLSPSGRFLNEGGGSSGLPLSSAFYVDSATATPLGDQNGFIGTPFAGVAQAVDAAIAGDVLILAPAPTPYACPAIAKNLTIQSVEAGEIAFTICVLAGSESPDSQLSLAHLRLSGDLHCSAVYGLFLGTDDAIQADLGGQFRSCQLGVLSDGGSGGNFVLIDSTATTVVAAGCSLRACSNPVAIMFTTELDAIESELGAVDGGGSGTVSLQGVTGNGAIVNVVSVDARDSELAGLGAISASGAVTLTDTDLLGALTAGGDVALSRSTVGGAVTVGGNASIWVSQLGAGLTVTGSLTIDAQSYAYATAHGTVSVTGVLTITGPYTKVVKQLAWNPAVAANSNLLTVLPAGHAPGFYVINSAMILQAVATTASAMNRQVKFKAPGFAGIQPITGSIFNSSATWTAVPAYLNLSTPSYNFNTIAFSSLSPVVLSDGTQPITLQMQSTGFTGTPSIDLYASADFVGALGN